MIATRPPLVVLALMFMLGPAPADESAPDGKVKIAAVQVRGYDKGDFPKEGYDVTGTLIPYIDRAGTDGAQLVVFPEYVLGRIQVPGPETERIADAAKANKIYVIVGCWEIKEGGQFANAALTFDRQGEIINKYYKTHAAIDKYDRTQPPWAQPPAGKDRDWLAKNDPEWIMEEGKELPVVECDFGKVGIMTCYDGWFPEPARVLSLKGAELIVWINGRGGEVEDFIVKSTMFRNLVAMVTTNQSYGGGTMIGDIAKWPTRIRARCPDEEESYISATVDLKNVRQNRATSRNFRQRRPDLYGEIIELEVPADFHEQGDKDSR